MLFFFVFLIILRSAVSQCPTGWIDHDEKCFKFFNEPVDFVQATDICSKQPSHLASFSSVAEFKWIVDTVTTLSTYNSFYLGLVVSGPERTLEFVDGSEIFDELKERDHPSSNFWGRGFLSRDAEQGEWEPANGTDNCIEVFTNTASHPEHFRSKMASICCKTQLPFVCKAAKKLPPTTNTTLLSTTDVSSTTVYVTDNVTTPGGDHVTTPGGDHVTTPGGGHVTTPDGDHVTTPGGDHVTTPGGDHVTTPDGDHVTTPGGDHVTTPDGDHVTTPGGDHVTTPGGDHVTTPGGEKITTADWVSNTTQHKPTTHWPTTTISSSTLTSECPTAVPCTCPTAKPTIAPGNYTDLKVTLSHHYEKNKVRQFVLKLEQNEDSITEEPILYVNSKDMYPLYELEMGNENSLLILNEMLIFPHFASSRNRRSSPLFQNRSTLTLTEAVRQLAIKHLLSENQELVSEFIQPGQDLFSRISSILTCQNDSCLPINMTFGDYDVQMIIDRDETVKKLWDQIEPLFLSNRTEMNKLVMTHNSTAFVGDFHFQKLTGSLIDILEKPMLNGVIEFGTIRSCSVDCLQVEVNFAGTPPLDDITISWFTTIKFVIPNTNNTQILKGHIVDASNNAFIFPEEFSTIEWSVKGEENYWRDLSEYGDEWPANFTGQLLLEPYPERLAPWKPRHYNLS